MKRLTLGERIRRFEQQQHRQHRALETLVLRLAESAHFSQRSKDEVLEILNGKR